MKWEPTWNKPLGIVLLINLINRGNWFVVMSKERVRFQSCNFSYSKHAVTSSQGRVLLCSIYHRSVALGDEKTSIQTRFLTDITKAQLLVIILFSITTLFLMDITKARLLVITIAYTKLAQTRAMSINQKDSMVQMQ